MITSTPSQSTWLWAAAMPGLFVFLWSTGFIGAKYGLPYAEPATFLAYRYTLVGVLLAGFALATGAPWPRRAMAWVHISISGLFILGLNLGGVFYAIYLGTDASVTALINGLQPLIVATIAASLLGQPPSARQWMGFFLGLGGVALVVWRKLDLASGTPEGMIVAFGALLGLSFGVVYQKKFCDDMDMRTGTAIQTGAAALAMWVLAFSRETMVIQWTGEFILAFTWLCLVMSVGALVLLMNLIRRGMAAKVSSLFFLVPAVTAILAYLMFGETFGPVALAGMVMALAGVALVNKGT